MQNQVTFHGENRGTQIGINTGTVTIHEDPPLVALDKLLSSAPQAAFDARESEHEERCLPGTRVEVLRDIHAWATSSKNEKCIFWLCGAAGTGKSTISRSIAQAFEDTKSLGASFFFKRGETDRGSAAKLFTTLAKQLAMSVPGLFSHIIAAASDDPGISEKGMKIQFEKIILEPLQKLDESGDLKETIRIVLVIDALDECDRDEDILPMIQLLSQLKRIIAVRLRVFLTSRPELPVRLGFKKLANEDHEDLVLHRISRSVIGHDIALFLNHQISEIRTARDQPLPMDWPGEEAMKKLVDLCVPLFIFAATICRIFRDDSWDPYESLPEILAQQKTSDADNLDGTYLPVLNRILRGVDTKRQQRVIVDFQHIVGTIVLLETPLSVSSLSKLLDLPVSRISFRLGQLHSVLRIPDDETLPVRPFHLSFRDFLLDPEIRAKTPLSIDEKMSHYELTLRCFALAQGLRRNICALPSDGTEQSEIDYDVVRKLFPPELQYACRYWAHHLVGCLGLGDEMASVNALDEALIFLYQHFLHWLEAMTLLKLSSEVVGILNLLASNITTEQYPVLFEFLQDAKRFVLKNRSITDQYPLQIYCTGLIFAPQTAVRRGFRSELPKSICQLPRVDQSWSTELQSLEGHTGSIVSVEFSPDGKLLVSSSPGYSPRTQDVRLWDVTTGSLLQNYTEKSDYNSSAGFSPDGKLLAFSSESAVQLWDITQDEEFMTLKRESNIVTPTGFSPHVLFSPDGKLLASILVDGNVQLWNVNSGQLDKSLEHTKFTWNNATSHMAFSSDSRQLASTAADGKTRLWDVSTGELKQTFLEQSEEHWSEFFFEAEGETSTAHSVAFSIDSRFLACGSDKTVRIWNISTGQIHHKFEGHTQSVFSVAFSRDGRLLATGSADKTVRVWNLQERTLLQTLTGHSSSVVSVAFSPDSGLLASGSHDRTVKIWDVTAKPPVQALAGHSKEVNLLVMSPDALILASASTDQSIKLWDIRKGTVRHTLKVYSDALEYTYALDDSVELMVFT